MPSLTRPIDNPTRRHDSWGSGQYRALRGGRLHDGLDIIARPGERIKSPIDGVIYKDVQAYKDDPSFRGVRIRGEGQWKGYDVKILYVQGSFSGAVRAGEEIGMAQDLSKRYPGIKNHIHLEVRKNGIKVSPASLFNLCF